MMKWQPHMKCSSEMHSKEDIDRKNMIYCKCRKFSNPKIETNWPYCTEMRPKNAERMANSADTNHLIWVYAFGLGLYVQKL